jgi:hypothetical protein
VQNGRGWKNLLFMGVFPLFGNFNPDYAIGIVTRVERAIKTGLPASIFFENVVTSYVDKKMRGKARICSYFGSE